MNAYIPKHRTPYVPSLGGRVEQSQAVCTCPHNAPLCNLQMCPRHHPVAYADHMAKHATDSF